MTEKTLRERSWMSSLGTAALTALMVGLTVLAAWSLLGAWSLLLSAVLALTAYRAFQRSSLPVRLANARRLGLYDAPELYQLVEWLSVRAGLERVPNLYLAAAAAPNAAAMGGRDDAAIFVTPALVRGLGERELAGVLAHEIGHIRNNDLGLYRFTELLRWIAALTSRVGWFLLIVSLPVSVMTGASVPIGSILLLVGAPLGAQLLQLAIMRSREFAADLEAARITGDPEGLAAALQRIEMANRWLLRALIPLPMTEEGALLRSHPPTLERVRRLRELAWAPT